MGHNALRDTEAAITREVCRDVKIEPGLLPVQNPAVLKPGTNNAKETIAWVSRNIICKDQGVMLLIYKSLIRPHLEYAVQCWAPSPRFGNWSIILELEKVQRKFTRLINDIGTLTYGERLKSLTLTTLAERRMRGDLIEAFKIIRGFADYGQNLFKLSISGLNILSKITKDTNSDRRDFFSERILKYWNILPKSVKMSESVKIALKLILRTIKCVV